MKKIISAIILIVMLSVTLFACNNSKDGTSSVPTSDSQSKAVSDSNSNTQSNPTQIEKYGKDIPVKDLDGRVIRVLCRDWGQTASIMGYNGEVIQRDDFDEKTADIVDVAKYQVRKLIETRYNCKIEGVLTADAPALFNNTVRNVALGTIDPYDLVFDAYGHAYPLITENVYTDMSKIKTINFENPWWDQNAREDLSIANKLYFMCGDINTYDNDGTWVIYFNKDLAAKSLPGVDLYKLVENNQWTFDKFVELCKGVTSDTDGIEGLSEFDTWGFGTEAYNAYVHVLASGQKIVQKDSNDIPFLSFKTDAMYKVLGDVMEFYTDLDTVMVANAGRFDNKGYASVWEETIIKAFREKRELFYMGGLINIVGYRSLDFKFGILPIPKATAEQDSYHHSVSMHNMSVLLMPLTSNNYEDLGLVVEALGAESKNILTPVYYDKCMKGKDASDSEDEKMLDLIFASRTYDLGSVFNWGGVINQFMTIDNNFASRFNAIYDKAQSELEQTLEFFQND